MIDELKNLNKIILTRDDFLISSYPGGEIRVTLKDIKKFYLIIEANILKPLAIELQFRCKTAEDIIVLSNIKDLIDHEVDCAAAITALRANYITILNLPYLPYGRQDRITDDCHNSLATFGKILKAMNWTYIETTDVHSVATEMMLENCSPGKISCYNNAYNIEGTIIQVLEENFLSDLNGPLFILSPDVGANKRTLEMSKLLTKRSGHYTDPLRFKFLQGTKDRDSNTGKIANFNLYGDIGKPGLVIVVDDICDGGGSFIPYPHMKGMEDMKFILYVTHGIFSGTAFEKLFNNGYQYIITTNSFHTKDELLALCPEDKRNKVTVHDIFQ